MFHSVPAKTLVMLLCLLLTLSVSSAQSTNLCEVILSTNLDVMQDTRYGAATNEALTLPSGTTVEFVGRTPDGSSYILRSSGNYLLSPVMGTLALPDGCTVAMWGAPPPNYRPLDEILRETGITAWQEAGYLGAGVRVGVLDARFDGLDAFIANSHLNARQFTFVQPLEALMLDREEASSTETFHGTNVLEVLTTIAPQAEYVIARAVNAEEFGSAVDALIGADVQIIVHAANVITPDPTPYHDAVRRAIAADILWVNSAGNIGAGYYPGRYVGRFRGHQFDDPNREGLQSDLMVAVDPNRDSTISLVWQGQVGQPNPNDFALLVSPSCDPRTAFIGEADGDQASGLDAPLEQVFLSAGDLSQFDDYTAIPPQSAFQNCALQPDGLPDNEIHILVGDSGGSAEVDTRFDLYVEGALPAEYDPDLRHSLDPVVLVPADLPEVLTVGAFDPTTNRMAWYSGRSNSAQYYQLNNNDVDYSDDEQVKPELVTYGEIALPSERRFFGTSASSAIVGGAATLILNRVSDFGQEALKELLTNATVSCLEDGAVTHQIKSLQLSALDISINQAVGCGRYPWEQDLSSQFVNNFTLPELAFVREEAAYQEQLALARGLASEVEAVTSTGNSPLGVLLGIRALTNYPYTVQAERALANAVADLSSTPLIIADADVTDIVWSDNNLLMFTAHSDGSIQIWNAFDGAYLRKQQVSPNSIISLSLSHSQDYILAIDRNHYMSIFRLGPDDLTPISMAQSEVLEARWHPQLDVAIYETLTGNRIAWDIESGSQLSAIDLSFSFGGLGTHLSITDLISPIELPISIYDVEQPGNFDLFRYYSPNGILAVETYSGIFRDFSVIETATDHTIFTTPNSYIGIYNDIVWSPDSNRLLIADEYGVIRILDAWTGRAIVEMQVSGSISNQDSFQNARWSPDGNWFAGTILGEVQIRSTVDGVLKTSWDYSQLGIEVNDIVWSPDSSRVLARSSQYPNVLVTVPLEQAVSLDHTGWTSFEISPSGDRLAISDISSTVIFNVQFGLVEQELTGISAKWSSDGTRLLYFHVEQHQLYIANTISWETELILPVPITNVELCHPYETSTWWNIESGASYPRFIWSPDNELIVGSTVCDTHLRVWDTNSEVEIANLDKEDNNFWNPRLYWLSESSNIVLLKTEGPLYIWNILSNEVSTVEPATVETELDAIARVSDRIFYAGEASGRIVMAPNRARFVEFYGTLIFGASAVNVFGDSLATVYNAESLEEITTYSHPADEYVANVVWSPVKNEAFTITSLGRLYRWHAWSDFQTLIQLARECCVWRNLTPVEIERYNLVASDSSGYDRIFGEQNTSMAEIVQILDFSN